jgi:hypothetical protein
MQATAATVKMKTDGRSEGRSDGISGGRTDGSIDHPGARRFRAVYGARAAVVAR